MTRHVQITQNNKFAISLQYLKKEESDKVEFLYADKHESLLQMVRHSQSSQNSKFASFYNTLIKQLKMKFIFCLQIIDLQLDFNTLDIKDSAHTIFSPIHAPPIVNFFI